MEALNQIEFLLINSGQIFELFLQKIPKWKADKKHFDKTGWGFNTDNRFKACDENVTLNFSSHMGTYGDSGCSTQCHLDSKLFQQHLVKYLNANVESVMIGVANSIKEEAAALKEKAEKELYDKLEKVQSLKV